MLSTRLSARFGKRTTFRICLFMSSMIMAAMSLIPPDSFAALLALQALLNLIFGPTIPILWAMMADVADYGEWKTGRRSTALAFASIVFGLKLGFGLGGWLNGNLLEYFGYSATGAVSPSASRGIVLMVSVFPAVALFIAAGLTFMYRLDDRLVKKIEQTLNVRRQSHNLHSTA
jgi:Na+/melibiose symporter-like transporter